MEPSQFSLSLSLLLFLFLSFRFIFTFSVFFRFFSLWLSVILPFCLSMQNEKRWIIDVKTEQLNWAHECALCSVAWPLGIWDTRTKSAKCVVAATKRSEYTVFAWWGPLKIMLLFLSFHFMRMAKPTSVFGLAIGRGKRNYFVRITKYDFLWTISLKFIIFNTCRSLDDALHSTVD